MESYEATRSFRTKLLGFLPLASGGGIFLLLAIPSTDHLGPIGLIGAVITMGLFLLEWHNVNRCHSLIVKGRELEKSTAGIFKASPYAVQPEGKGWFAFLRPRKHWLVLAAAVLVYGAVGFGWGYVACVGFGFSSC